MHVFSNLATSVDGKIATVSREFFPIGTAYDRKMMQVIRKKADCIAVGAGTIASYKKPNLIAGAKKQPLNAILSSRLDGLDSTWPFFTSDKIKRVIFITPDTPADRREIFSRSCTLIEIRRETPHHSLGQQMMDHLKKMGVKNLLVEGGGSMMWDFAHENLIDTYYVTLVPKIIGGRTAPTMVDGPGFPPTDVLNLKLKSMRKVGNELYLVYTKTKKRG